LTFAVTKIPTKRQHVDMSALTESSQSGLESPEDRKKSKALVSCKIWLPSSKLMNNRVFLFAKNRVQTSVSFVAMNSRHMGIPMLLMAEVDR
jgi:hypothetical protein